MNWLQWLYEMFLVIGGIAAGNLQGALRARRRAEPWRERLESLARLGPDWDSYGAEPIDPRAIEAASTFLKALERPTAIVPTSDGGVQLEWHGQGCDMELAFRPDGSIEEDDQ